MPYHWSMSRFLKNFQLSVFFKTGPNYYLYSRHYFKKRGGGGGLGCVVVVYLYVLGLVPIFQNYIIDENISMETSTALGPLQTKTFFEN